MSSQKDFGFNLYVGAVIQTLPISFLKKYLSHCREYQNKRTEFTAHESSHKNAQNSCMHGNIVLILVE